VLRRDRSGYRKLSGYTRGVAFLAVLALWLRLMLGGERCLLVVGDDMGPPLPNRHADQGPAAIDDGQTGLECRIYRW
jgi:hypothetical protein